MIGGEARVTSKIMANIGDTMEKTPQISLQTMVVKERTGIGARVRVSFRGKVTIIREANPVMATEEIPRLANNPEVRVMAIVGIAAMGRGKGIPDTVTAPLPPGILEAPPRIAEEAL